MLNHVVSLPASDFWALGCCIYQMHTGRLPFSSDKSEMTSKQTFDRILSGDLFIPEELKREDDFKSILAGLMH